RVQAGAARDGGAQGVPGAEPGGEALPPPQGPAGGGAGVLEEPRADSGAAVRAGVGLDGAGAYGEAGAEAPGGQAFVRAVPGGPTQPLADRAGHRGGVRDAEHRHRAGGHDHGAAPRSAHANPTAPPPTPGSTAQPSANLPTTARNMR